MSQYNFVSPGAAAGAGLEDVLARNRAEARQRMLDEVSKRNIESEMQARRQQSDIAAQNAASMEQYRTGEAARWQAEADERTSRVDARKKMHQGITDYIAGHPDMDEKTRTGLEWANMGEDDDLLKTMIGKFMTPQTNDEWFPVYDENGNDTGNWAPKGAHFLPREPRQPATPKQTFTTPGLVTEDGRLVTVVDGVPYAVNPKTGKNEVYSGKIGAKPTMSNRKPGQVPSAVQNKLTDLRGKASREANMFGLGGATKQDIAAYNQAMENFISDYDASPDVKETVRAILASPKDQGNSTDVIVKRHKGVFNDDDAYKFEDMLYTTRGR